MCRRCPERNIQVTLHYNGVGIAGTGVKLVTYPTSNSNVISMEVLTQRAYFAAVGLDGDLHVCNLSSLEVELLVRNNSESCKEIKKLCKFEDRIAFTDSGDGKLKFLCPSEKNFEKLMGFGQEGASHGTYETCSFTQVQGICSMEKTLFVSDVVSGWIKIASGPSGTLSFLQLLRSLYNSFGVRAQSIEKAHTSTEFANINFMRPLPSEEINPETESVMREYVEKYRPMRQRTIREKTSKLPPAVHKRQQDSTEVKLLAGLGNDFNSGDQPIGPSCDNRVVQAISECGNVTDVTFVDDCIIEVVVAKVRTYADESDTVSEIDFSDREDEDVTAITVLDPDGQFAPIFTWIFKLRSQ